MADFLRKISVALFIGLGILLLFKIINNSVNNLSKSLITSRLEESLPEPGSDFDFTRTMLQISAVFDGNSDIEAAGRKIDKMADDLKSKLGEEGNPQEKIRIMNRFFFEDHRYVFNEKANSFFTDKDASGLTPQDLINFNSVNYALTHEQGICITISIIYLMMADKLGLPINGIIVPGHFYCRYKEHGRSAINIETTSSGIEFYEYESLPGANIEFIGGGTAYNRLLTKEQALGAYLNNAGTVMLFLNKKPEAEAFFRQSIRFLDNLPEAYNNLGYVLLEQGETEESEQMLLKAASIYPDYWLPYAHLGSLYLGEKRFLKAEENLEKALRINPDSGYVREKLREAKSGGY